MVDVKKIVENKINQIWSETPAEVTTHMPPLTIAKIPDAQIIFIGLNPSLSPEDRSKLLKRSNKSLEFYALDGDEDRRYFKKFPKISRQTQLSWTHFDLLFIRETKQSKVKQLLKTQAGRQFLYRQLMVSKLVLNQLIEKDKPKIFVVNNTLAREFLGKDRPINYADNQEYWLNYKFDWDEKLGTYTYKESPFFFSSMLTGQRALDRDSFERLIWRILDMLKLEYSSE